MPGTPIPSSTNPSLIRRGITLLEALIALVLIAAVGAIVAPTVLDRLDERAFEAAADGTSEQLMMARAHAQATGEPVEVTYSPSTGNVHARIYAPWETASDLDAIEPGTSPLASVPNSETPPLAASRQDDSSESKNPVSTIAEGWATRTLSKGMRIGNHPPFAQGGDSGMSGEEEICMPDGTLITVVTPDEDYETLEDLEHGQDVRLAVFMPDGSAMVGEELWLDDGRGRCGRISINAWSGLPMFQRIADLQARSEAAAAKPQNDDSFSVKPSNQDQDDRNAERDD